MNKVLALYSIIHQKYDFVKEIFRNNSWRCRRKMLYLYYKSVAAAGYCKLA